jgi:hypothetical protein
MSQMMNSGSVWMGMGIRPGKPVINRGGMTSSMGTMLSLSLPPPRRLSLARTKAIFFVRLLTIQCIFMWAIFSSSSR